MNISSNQDFKKDYKKLHKKIQERFKERIILFQKDPVNPILNNHPLRGKYEGYRSINITGDIRAIFRKSGDEVTFVEVGSHSKLYG